MMDDLMPGDRTPTETELTRLADGTLSAAERDRVLGLVNASPELTTRLEEQSRAVSLMRSADDVCAPASLRSSLEQMSGGSTAKTRRRSPQVHTPRWQPRLCLPAATALAAAIVVVTLVLSGTAAPTVAQTGRLALAAAQTPAPAASASDRDVLDIQEAGIAFPSYLRTAGRAATGARRDTLHGRRVTTVFYRAADGTRVGYAIVAGAALPYPSGRSVIAGGFRYVLARLGSAHLVTWRRQGHTCVIAGRTVSDRTLFNLAIADDQRLS